MTRLIDMKVKPFLVASSVRAIMAQRLVRRICKNCAQPYTPQPSEIMACEIDDDFIKNAKLMKGKGCAQCGNTGYKGRMGVYEIFLVSDEIRHYIYGRESADVIRNAAIKGGMRNLRGDALRKAAAGSTTLEEVIRVTVSGHEEE